MSKYDCYCPHSIGIIITQKLVIDKLQKNHKNNSSMHKNLTTITRFLKNDLYLNVNALLRYIKYI